MIVKKGVPFDKWTKVDNKIIEDISLSDGAFRMYTLLYSWPNGMLASDACLASSLQISQTVVTRRKKELKDRDLILSKRVAAGMYELYIGCSGKRASEVYELWKNKNGGWRRDEV